MAEKTSNRKKVLVCTPTYNSAGFLEETLRSVAGQTYDNFDLLVVDNASEDDTVILVDRFRKSDELNGVDIKLVINDENLGRVQNWNRCLELFLEGDYEYLKFVFAGDILEKNCLETLTEGIEESGVGMAVGGYAIEGGGKRDDHRLLGRTKVLGSEEALRLFVEMGNWVGAPIATLFKRSAVSTLRFAEHLDWAADWKFYVDLANLNKTYYTHTDVGTLYRENRKHLLVNENSHSAHRQSLSVKQYALALLVDIDPSLYKKLEKYLFIDKGKNVARRVLPGIVTRFLRWVRRSLRKNNRYG